MGMRHLKRHARMVEADQPVLGRPVKDRGI